MVSGPGLDPEQPLTGAHDSRSRGYVPLDLLAGSVLGLGILLLLLAGSRVHHGGGLLLIHVGLLLAILTLGGVPRPASLPLRFLRDTYALWGLPLAYKEAGLLGRAFHSPLNDFAVLRWEHGIFGLFPSVWLQVWMPSVALSSFLHLFYLASFALVPLIVVWLYAQGHEDDCRILSFTLVLTIVTCYLITVAFPVAGPLHVFLRDGEGDGLVGRIVRNVLLATTSRGTSFPSSHVAGMTAAILIGGRTDRRVAPWIVVLGVMTLFAVLYCGFNHGVSVLAGLALGVAGALIGPRVHEVLRPLARRAPAGGPPALPPTDSQDL